MGAGGPLDVAANTVLDEHVRAMSRESTAWCGWCGFGWFVIHLNMLLLILVGTCSCLPAAAALALGGGHQAVYQGMRVCPVRQTLYMHISCICSSLRGQHWLALGLTELASRPPRLHAILTPLG